jgi:hypothetical protein
MKVDVDTEIPYGNACDIFIGEEDGIPVVEFAADPHGGPEALWFCLRVISGSAGRDARIKLVLKNSRTMLGGDEPDKMRPVTRSTSTSWERMGPGRKETLTDGRFHAVWDLDMTGEWSDVALCYPYGRAQVEKLVEETGGYWKADTIGVSQGARPITRLSNYHTLKSRDTPGLFFVARQHSGETPGSWVLDGLLRQIASLGDQGPFVWAIPLSNIDGVEQGDYGKDNFPYDVNRAWGDPSWRHETLVCKRDLSYWLEQCRPFVGIDFHAPGGWEAEGMYAFLPDPEQYEEGHRRAEVAARSIGEVIGEYAKDPFSMVPRYLTRWKTPGFIQYCCGLGFCGLGVEVPYGLANGILLTQEDYREMGRRTGLALNRLVSNADWS